jgi:membrane fusion protein YbhG
MITNDQAKMSDKTEGRSKRKVKRIVIPVVLILALAGALVWYFLLRRPDVPANIIEVSGRIESDDAAVAAKAGGRIREITVREGDRVKAGQVIALLDDEQMKARVDQAEAAVTQADARVQRARQQIAVLQEQLNQSNISVEQADLDARGRVTQAEAQVAAAEAQLAQAEANYKQAKYDRERFARLYRTGDVSEQQALQTRTAAESQLEVVQAQRRQVESARGALTAARAYLANPRIRTSQAAAIKAQIAQALSDINSATADAERARAQLREAAANRGDLNVIAPFDGTVATRTSEPGEVVSPGTSIITLVDLNAVYLRAFVPEGDIGRVRIGQASRVYLDSSPTQPIEAEVMRIDPEASFTPENTYFRDERVKQVVGVKLRIKNPQGFAKPGMPADGEILVAGDWNTPQRAK